MDTKWVKDSFDKGKIEVLKFARTSKIKIEITSLNKKKDERVKLLGNKVLELIEKGELNSEQFEPDYTYIKNIDSEIEEKEDMLAMEDEEERFDEQESEDSDKIDIVQIESQKVITADSIPVPEEQEAKKEEENKDYTI